MGPHRLRCVGLHRAHAKVLGNGRKIPKEAQRVTVVLGVGAVDGFKIRNTVYTWPNAGVSEPLILWGEVVGRQ